VSVFHLECLQRKVDQFKNIAQEKKAGLKPALKTSLFLGGETLTILYASLTQLNSSNLIGYRKW